MIESVSLAPVGTVTNITGATTRVGPNETVAFEFQVTAIGGTPTVSYTYEGSLDGVVFYPIAYVTDATDTVSVAARVVTAVGTTVQFLSNPVARRYEFYRVVTTAILNVTYQARCYRVRV